MKFSGLFVPINKIKSLFPPVNYTIHPIYLRNHVPGIISEGLFLHIVRIQIMNPVISFLHSEYKSCFLALVKSCLLVKP